MRKEVEKLVPALSKKKARWLYYSLLVMCCNVDRVITQKLQLGDYIDENKIDAICLTETTV